MLCVGTNWPAANVCRKSHVSAVHVGINDAPALAAADFGVAMMLHVSPPSLLWHSSVPAMHFGGPQYWSWRAPIICSMHHACPWQARGSLLGPMSCYSALALYVCLRSAGAAIAIDAVMKVASTNCASIKELAQLGTFNTRAHDLVFQGLRNRGPCPTK